ncbi:MAG: disulfide bond formation protein B [Actinomycetota bacterium]|nr:disulfide bond formation protein B [Actinomycetes bacterium]
MIDSKMITFLSLLALLCVAFLACVLVLSVVSLFNRGLPESVRPLREGMAQAALPMAFAVATMTTAGSLWLSEVEKLPPCYLCWWQRGFMYPQVLILGLALLWPAGRRVLMRWISLPMVIVGAGISTYHYLVERFPDSIETACSTSTPCSTVWIWKYHFLSIPGMAWVAFLTIAALILLYRPKATSGERVDNIEEPIEAELTK